MAKYKVTFTVEYTEFVEVEAEDAEEAMDKAWGCERERNYDDIDIDWKADLVN